jgi:hypothetical protein
MWGVAVRKVRMRKVALLLVVLLCVSGLVFAYGSEGPKGDKGDKGDQGIQGIPGSDASCDKDIAAGPGIDLLLWHNAKNTVAVESQYKWDVINSEHSVYGVVKVNVWDMLFKKN